MLSSCEYGDLKKIKILSTFIHINSHIKPHPSGG
jgi:hypothetical protein